MVVVHIHLSGLFVGSVNAPVAMCATDHSAMVLFVLVSVLSRLVAKVGVVRVVVVTRVTVIVSVVTQIARTSVLLTT